MKECLMLKIDIFKKIMFLHNLKYSATKKMHKED